MSALVIDNLSKRFGGLRAVSNICLTIQPGERWLIIGPNGAGKTTLFNMIAGAIGVTAGSVHLFGRDITHLPAHLRARMGLARTFQITNLFPRLTVLDNLLLALQARDGGAVSLTTSMQANHRLIAEAKGLLETWGLAALSNRPARAISYGEKRLVDLLLAMAVRPKLLLLDEPNAGLSAAETIRIVDMVRRLPRDITILMIEHDMDIAFDLVDRVAVLHQGCLIVEGNGAFIRGHPRVNEIYLGGDEPC